MRNYPCNLKIDYISINAVMVPTFPGVSPEQCILSNKLYLYSAPLKTEIMKKNYISEEKFK